MMSHRATVDDGDPLPPLPPEASWASSEKTLLQLSLTYDEWPGARRDDGKQLMRWRPASDRSLKVQVGSYSRAADTRSCCSTSTRAPRASAPRSSRLVSGGAAALPRRREGDRGRHPRRARRRGRRGSQPPPRSGARRALVLALLACAATLARPLAVAAASLDLRTDDEVGGSGRARLLKKVYVIRERLEHQDAQRSGARTRRRRSYRAAGC